MKNRVPKSIWLLVIALLVTAAIPVAITQASSPGKPPAWVPAAWTQALNVPLLPSILAGVTPPTIPATMTFANPTGKMTTTLDPTGTLYPGGTITTSQQSFFASLGSNKRTCVTCHQMQNGWSITPASVLATYALSQGKDPLFAPVDGADCPDRGSANTKFNSAFLSARTQLFTKGTFRIFIPAPTTHSTVIPNPPPAPPTVTVLPGTEWYSVSVTSDPTGCENSSKYGMKANPPVASFYRRPLSSTSQLYDAPGAVGPAANIMWDTREPSLQSQFVDATMVHAQATPAQIAALQASTGPDQGALFQRNSFTGQSYDSVAGDLTGADGSGGLAGPLNLFNYSNTIFFAPFGGGCFVPINPCPGSFGNTAVGTNLGTALYLNPSFATSGTSAAATAMRASIARGEALYSGTDPLGHGIFTIAGVTGLNELGIFGPPGAPIPNGTCSLCHNNVNVGNDDFLDPKHLGIADNGYADLNGLQKGANGSSTLLPTADSPLFTFYCPVGTITFFSNPVQIKVNGQWVMADKYQTTDPGVGWITGNCGDLGKFKVPQLRGLASRAPFFHNGQATSMLDVIKFYENRFSMHLTAQDEKDLVNFMNTL